MLARKMTVIFVCGLLLMLSGCGGGDGGNDGDGVGGNSNVITSQSGTLADGERFPTELSASHILITHKDSTWHPPDVTRSRSEAEDLARRIAVLARERGADFAELARKYSEDPTAQDTGGYLGIFQRGDMVIAFEVAVNSMKLGQTGVVMETDYGFHVVKRHPIRRVHAHHILIAWRGAVNVSGGVGRSKETARQLAKEVRSIALTEDVNLCDLAQKWSDDPNNKASCGDLGVVEPGYLAPVFEETLFKLRLGQISKGVESAYGFHIIWRE
jgi:peptidyl-prolyl cis-trans isomerase SurA